MNSIEWTCKKFADLTPFELYDFIRLRNEVFVVEQNCVFQDADNMDQQCYHVSGYQEKIIVAYSRLVPPGVIYTQASIGRVITAPSARKSGAGKALMQKSIELCEELFPSGPLKIGAQLYLKKFYESFGFKQTGDVYDEDGIDHIHMIR